MSKEDLKKKYGHKYYSIAEDGELVERDKSKEEKQAKKNAQNIEKIYKKAQKENSIEELERVLYEIKVLLNEIIKASRFSKSQVTIESLNNSKNKFQIVACRLLDVYLSQIAEICKRLMNEDISKESFGWIRIRIDILMEKIGKVQSEINSVGEKLTKEAEEKIEKTRTALRESIKYVQSRERSREIKALLEGDDPSEKAYRAHISGQIHNAGFRSPMDKYDIDVPVDSTTGSGAAAGDAEVNGAVDMDISDN